MAAERLRINPGGTLTLPEIVGRDEFVAAMWETLEVQSVMLTAERRMGKTSVLLKLESEPSPAALVIKRSLQGIRSPEEFVARMVVDIEQADPGLLKKSFRDRVAELGIKSVGGGALSLEFSPRDAESWKHVATETFAALDQDLDGIVVLLWDELPQMIADIREDRGAPSAREVLDVLRQTRESHRSLRMVLSGSLGIHHVVADLRSKGGMWMPNHDMRSVDLPPLAGDAAHHLASELLRNEEIGCEEIDAVAATIVAEADHIPFYIHQTALALRERHRSDGAPIGPAAVAAVVAAAIEDPLDPWELGHYVARTPVYYEGDAPVVNRILDLLAAAAEPLSADEIRRQLAAFDPPPPVERLHEILELLCKDYYLGPPPGYCFLRSLVRRAWLAKRPPR